MGKLVRKFIPSNRAGFGSDKQAEIDDWDEEYSLEETNADGARMSQLARMETQKPSSQDELWPVLSPVPSVAPSIIDPFSWKVSSPDEIACCCNRHARHTCA